MDLYEVEDDEDSCLADWVRVVGAIQMGMERKGRDDIRESRET